MRTLIATKLGASIMAAAAFAAAVLPMPAAAQRLSLAERVAKLEAQAQAGQGNVDLVNQLQALQTEVQQLHGQVEQLRHQLDELKERNKQQYIDIDSRLGRLEGGAGAAGGARPGAAANDGHLEDIQLGAPGDAPQGGAGDLGTDPSLERPELAPPPRATELEPPAPTHRVDPAAEKATYDEAYGALKEGRYAESARKFQAFIDTYPNSELTSNAYYWLGESYYVTQNYRVSLDTFQTLLRNYPDSQKAPDALLKVGYCQYELKQWGPAESTLNKVVQKYPDTVVARLAQGRLRALKLEGAR
ncbi:tol-pal system protein YbgF [Tahibacter soli]|jgi:tol-pal system protein YbgF|uniref:Cell division coordinator CpoB n=1 Tax=Tahibacter soli TaxID=2983605 RepID=A0A9X3YQT0_9GAMM|nr:tol-pal system protein YbgF [Tahibacter soli]MDC8015785.1 tol-pal system protein YbgF [Tahibacter soli]